MASSMELALCLSLTFPIDHFPTTRDQSVFKPYRCVFAMTLKLRWEIVIWPIIEQNKTTCYKRGRKCSLTNFFFEFYVYIVDDNFDVFYLGCN